MVRDASCCVAQKAFTLVDHSIIRANALTLIKWVRVWFTRFRGTVVGVTVWSILRALFRETDGRSKNSWCLELCSASRKKGEQRKLKNAYI